MTKLVGIINITPDSFSDDGMLDSKDSALKHAHYLITSGADILDIGAESTRPGATPLTHEQEWKRLEPILADMITLAHSHQVAICLDSYHPRTQQRALMLGIDIINDQTGLTNPEMINIIKDTNGPIIIMHHLGIPTSKNITIPINDDPIETVKQWATATIVRLNQAGIDSKRLILDPGIGFGKTAHQSLDIIQRISELKSIGLPLYVGHSRKSFLAEHCQVLSKNRDVETLAISSYLQHESIDYLRIHNVQMHHQFFQARHLCKD